VSLDALLGRKEPDDTTLTFALTLLADYVRDAERQILQAQGVAADIGEQLEAVEETFDLAHIESLQRVARDMAGHLDAAYAKARELSSSTAVAIAEAPEEVPESGAGRRRDPN
jgi:hypothetical protein